MWLSGSETTDTASAPACAVDVNLLVAEPSSAAHFGYLSLSTRT
jgi:hypothetical protein